MKKSIIIFVTVLSIFFLFSAPVYSTPPVVTPVTPANNSALPGDKTVFLIFSVDDTSATVVFNIDGSEVTPTETLSGEWSYSWNLTYVPRKIYNITAVATDTSGNTGSATIFVDVIAPAGETTTTITTSTSSSTAPTLPPPVAESPVKIVEVSVISLRLLSGSTVIKKGTEDIVRVFVENSGSEDAEVTIALYSDDEILESETTDLVPYGFREQRFLIRANRLQEGRHTLKAKITVQGESVEEVDPSNNERTLDIVVEEDPSTSTTPPRDNNNLLLIVATILGIATIGSYLWIKKPTKTKPQEVIRPASLKPSYSTAIEVSDLVKKYRNSVVLENVSFTVPSGILCTIVGLSGGGKSTIVEAIAGRIPPDSGKVTIVGKDADKNRMELNRIVGFVPQHPELNMNQTVWENMINSTIKWEVKEAGLKSTVILKQLGILDRKDVVAKNLSGGQLKRLSLAMELIREPEILVLDEPTTGLDPTSRDQILTALTKIVTTNKKTVLFTTHFMDEAEHCDEVIIIGDAKVLVKGPPSQLARKLPGMGKIVIVTVEEVSETLVKNLEKLPSVKKVIREGRVLKIISDKPDPVELSQKVKELGGTVEKSEVKKAGMKEVFVYFTGKIPEE